MDRLQVFDIELETSAATAAFDGRCRDGRLVGKFVNVRWYLKREGILDTLESDILDYYLVMTGPRSSTPTSSGTTRPWCIDNVYLFDARVLNTYQAERGLKIGVASSVKQALWSKAEIYPATNDQLPLTSQQQATLAQFSSGLL